ncbi:MAG TPA: hypothetical protein VL979_03045 [Solirubrobacteraceae bacterium]|nr:hypothetical protein [Solirubrobacteraceae bacterium]
MTPATRLSAIAAMAACAALLACAALVTPVSAAGVTSESQAYTAESLKSFEAQLDAGEVASVRFDPKLHEVRVILKSGQHVLAHYEAHHQLKLAKLVRSHHLKPLTIHGKTVGKAGHPGHKLRYIVGGAIVVVLVLVGAGLVFVLRRRRALSDF